MNKTSFVPRSALPLPGDRGGGEDVIDLQKIWLMARRQMMLVAVCGIVGALAGIVLLRASPPSFSSASQVLVDLNLNRVVGTVSPSPTPSAAQSDAQILSSIEVLKSKRMALAVVDELDLTRDPAFANPPASVIGEMLQPVRTLAGLLKGAEDGNGDGNGAPAETEPRLAPAGLSPQERQRDAAAETLRQRLSAERLGRSFVLGIAYVSHDPALSHHIVEAYTQAFMSDQRIATVDASRQATDWMKGRIDELAAQAQEASLAAERFRAENNLSVARGELVSEQRLAELNGQLVISEGELAQVQGRSQQMDAIVAAGRDAAVENAVLASSDVQSPRVAELRNRFIEQRRRRAEIAARWGADHPQAAGLQREIDATADLLFAELQQVAAQNRSELAVAQNRRDALRAQIALQTGENASSNRLLVELKDLEQRAQTLNQLYASTLASYEQAVQSQSFPVSNLRVISPATVPASASGPRFMPVVGALTILGLLAGCGVGILREFGDRSFRTGQSVPASLGVKFLGYLPALKRRGRRQGGELMRAAVASPASSFAEVLRNVRLHLDAIPIGGPGRVLGVVSVLPGEGKSTVAANLAGLLARGGARVVLIDADFRRPAVGTLLAPDAGAGLVDAVAGRPWREAVVRDPASGLVVMPNLAGALGAQGAETLGSEAMGRLVAELRGVFDYVVLDLPPVGPVVDAAAVQPHVDAFLLVLRWGSTPVELAQQVIGAEGDIAHKIVGAVLNRTDLDALKRYGGAGSEARAYKRYKAYYKEPA